MSRFGVVFKKELKDGLRDRRSLLSLLMFPFVGPVLVALILTQTAEQLSGSGRTPLPVDGRERAPELMRFLEDHDVDIREPPADAMAAVQRREVDAVLRVPADYPERYRQGKPAYVELVIDESRTEAFATVQRVDKLIQAYAKGVGGLRLLAHGVSPDVAEPIKVNRIDLSTPKKRAAMFLNMIPMFALLAAFIGGMYTATDSTAGERERGSLEPLLITPVRRRSLVLGKWLVTVLFSSTTVVLTLTATLVALGRVPMGKLGITLTLGAPDVAGILLCVLPLALLVGSAQLFVATFARTFKEAQTYLSLMIFLPMLPGVLTTLTPIKTKLWMTAVPVLAQQVLLGDIIRGEVVPPLGFALAALSSLVGAALCIAGTAALFGRERIVFGR